MFDSNPILQQSVSLFSASMWNTVDPGLIYLCFIFNVFHFADSMHFSPNSRVVDGSDAC
jgi:hypothetical protein